MSHLNSGACLKCAEIRDRYPGWNEELWNWFQALQNEHLALHLSCFGRGQEDQETLFLRKATRAHFGESAHNWNQAIDVFELREGVYTLDSVWFQSVIAPNLAPTLKWYGLPGSSFYELPHIEIANWRTLAKNGLLNLVAGG